MMKKWNEIEYKTALRILENFINKEDWTIDKVLEIQDPYSLLITKQPNRFYIGNCIHEVKELGNYTNPYSQSISRLQGWNKIEKKDFINIVMIGEDKKPLVLPLFKGLDQIDMPLSGYITSPIPRWWRREEGQRIYKPKEYPKEIKNLYIRIRAFNLETWRNMVLGYLNNEGDLNSEGDLKIEDFTIA